MTQAGIKPATFRFVAQHLNYCATAVQAYYSNKQSDVLCSKLLVVRAVIKLL